jgi:RNA ligase
LDTRVEVTDKLDGSLGILYPTPDGEWAVATRGSFDSEQARHATKVWQRKYADQCGRLGIPFAGMTMLFEIIYPANRIVCDYSDLDDLVLLGAVEIEHGYSFSPYEDEAVGDWPGPRAVCFGHPTLADALAMKPRPGAEGVVVRRWHSEDRIKLKQDEYVTLHRLITGCTARRLWESLAVNACAPLGDTKFLTRRLFLAPDRINGILEIGPAWLEPFVTKVPEEFRDWVIARVQDMLSAVAERRAVLNASFEHLLFEADVPRDASPSREDSKKFAATARAQAGDDFNLMMSLWRGHEIASTLWREIRPEHELPYRAVDESVA